MHNKKVIVGKFGSVFGVKGWIKLHSFTEPFKNILDFDSLLLNKNDEWQILKIEDSRVHHQQLVVKIPGINDPDSARKLTNLNIAVFRNQFPKLPENEFYCTDLEGMTVTNIDNLVLGKVDYILPTKANDVIAVTGEKKYFIPYISNVIQEVDLARSLIKVDWAKDDLG